MFKKFLPLLLILILLSPYPVMALLSGGSTESYNYNPFEEEVMVETTEDFTLLVLILVILVLILYKGEITLENIMKINHRRRIKKIIKNKRKSVRKRIKEKEKKFKKRTRKKKVTSL